MDMSKLAHQELPPPIPPPSDTVRMQHGIEALVKIKHGPKIPMPPAAGLYSHAEELEFLRELLRANRTEESLVLVERMLMTKGYRGMF